MPISPLHTHRFFFFKRLFCLFAVLLIMDKVYAQTRFELSVPQTVVKGENFRLEYILTGAIGSTQDASFPKTIDGVDILFDPVAAHWKTTPPKTIYTITVRASKEGYITIPSATIEINGNTLKSNTSRIRVLPAEQDVPSSKQNASTKTTTKIDNSRAFARAIVSSTNIYEQEAISLIIRVYSRGSIKSIDDIKAPNLDGFTIINQTEPNIHRSMENYQGINYSTYDLMQYILYPQQSGNITIPAFDLSLSMEVNSQLESHLGPILQIVKREFSTTPINMQVKPLPTPKPNNFANAIGSSFRAESSVNNTQAKVNEPIEFTLRVTGEGNTRYMAPPSIHLPQELELSDPDIDLGTQNSSQPSTKTFVYTITPQSEGAYTVPSIHFSYFDPSKNRYEAVSTQPITLNIEGFAEASQQAQSFGEDRTSKKDILPLIATSTYQIDTEPFWGSSAFILIHISLLIISMVVICTIRWYKKQQEKPSWIQNKKALQAVNSHLKEAQIAIKEGNTPKAYQELYQLMWKFIQYKFGISISQLNREHVAIQLAKTSLSDDIRTQVLDLLDTLQFAQYSSAKQQPKSAEKIYLQTKNIINLLEKSISTK